MGKSNTNMASEFWFFSQLYRLGYKAYITLGNTKSVDIIVQLSDGSLLTFDVKGKESFNTGTYMYLSKVEKENHFYVFVGLQIKKNKGKIIIESEPECYILKSENLKNFAHSWGTKGYGFDQNIFRVIKKYNSEDEIVLKMERKRVSGFKKMHEIDYIDFPNYKSKILTLKDFENINYLNK